MKTRLNNFKKVIFTIVIFTTISSLGLHAQDYLISFAGTGGSTTVTTVKVENLTQGTNQTINGSDILHLMGVVTGIEKFNEMESSKLTFSPNPMKEYTRMQFVLPEPGEAIITLHDLSGRNIVQIRDFLSKGQHTYRLHDIGEGLYIVKISSGRYSLQGRLISSGPKNNRAKLVYENTIPAKENQGSTKGINSETVMQYNTGDRLKLTGSSGNYSTVITDVPSTSKSITFNFITCTDGDANNYPIVQIGTQIWMAENLKTTKYRNGDAIGTTNPTTLDISGQSMPKYQWSYNGNENNVPIYGRLYTWYVVTDSRFVCPNGWHSPTNAEWITLENYLIINGFNFDGTTSENKIGKSLAATTNWTSSSKTGAVGNTDYPAKRNATGFTALPGGARSPSGSFLYLPGGGVWWSATQYDSYDGWIREIYYAYYNLEGDGIDKSWGYSVRCIKDN